MIVKDFLHLDGGDFRLVQADYGGVSLTTLGEKMLINLEDLILSERVDLAPHDLAFPLLVFNPLVDEATATSNPFKHLLSLKYMCYSTLK